MAGAIRVRDVVHGVSLDLGPDEPILRVPYDLFKPTGAVRQRGTVVEWLDAGTPKMGRTAPASLGQTHPGERVLLQLEHDVPDTWWLCEVETVDGHDQTASDVP